MFEPDDPQPNPVVTSPPVISDSSGGLSLPDSEGYASQKERPQMQVRHHTLQTNRVLPRNNNAMMMKRPNQWRQDLLGCCNSPGICCCGFFCEPCLFCQNASRLEEDPVMYFCLKLCGFPMNIALRSLARERFGIKGTFAEDVIVATCCDPCSMCQIANEIDMQRM